MKTLVLFAILLSSASYAAPKAKRTDGNICNRFMTCGTYIAARDEKDPDSVETKIVISSIGQMKGQFDYVLTNKEGQSTTWPLEATFQEDGSAVMKFNGKSLYAVAICKYNICDYAMVPFDAKEQGFRGNAGIMRFTETSMEFMMTWGVPTEGGTGSRAIVLQKQ